MIKQLSDFLRELQVFEQSELDKQDIKHAPTIGAMYEGLTKDLLERAIPAEAGLKLVNGFVVAPDGTLSPQIDCMLVVGAGEPVPYVENCYKWPIHQVLAVIEIKKNLYGAEIKDSYEKLQAIIEAYTAHEMSGGNKGIDITPAAQAFAMLTGIYPSSMDEANKLADGLDYIFHILVGEQLAPLRIVLGYGGYATEHGLRKGFADYLEQHGNNRYGYGVPSLPSLIICGANSLIKLNGQPYNGALQDHWWDVMASNSENPLRILLELIWMRISILLDVDSPPEGTLVQERLAAFLSAKFVNDGKRVGFEYKVHNASQKALAEAPPPKEWEPVEIDMNEFVLLNMLAGKGTISFTDADFIRWTKAEGVNPEAMIARLTDRGLLARNGDQFRLINSKLQTGFLPDGTSYAATNPEMVVLWSMKKIQEHKKADNSKS